MKAFTYAVIPLFLAISSLQAHAINNSTEAHYAIHAMEKLVGEGKIEEAFQTSFKTLSVRPDSTGTNFTVLLQQISGVDKTARGVELTMNNLGVMVSYKLVDGMAANNPPTWPTADAHELGEDAMHYLLDNVETHPEFAPFDKDMAGLTISQSIMAEHAMTMAVVDITSTSTTDILRITEDTDGVEQSASIVHP